MACGVCNIVKSSDFGLNFTTERSSKFVVFHPNFEPHHFIRQLNRKNENCMPRTQGKKGSRYLRGPELAGNPVYLNQLALEDKS